MIQLYHFIDCTVILFYFCTHMQFSIKSTTVPHTIIYDCLYSYMNANVSALVGVVLHANTH